MPVFSFDDGIVETDYTSSSTPSPIDYFTGLTSLNFVITGFDSLYDMGIGLLMKEIGKSGKIGTQNGRKLTQV